MASSDKATRASSPMNRMPQSSGWRLFFQYYFWFPLGYVLFGFVGLPTSLLSLGLSYLLPAHVAHPLGQRLIQRLFAIFVGYLEKTGICHFDFQDLAQLRHFRGGIIVANHPCLLDAVLLISQLPKVICLMKEGILTNLVLCGTARLAGYVDNHSARYMVESCADRVRAGETLVIFPEGSRTVHPGVNPFKMGFALVARLSSAPIQTVIINTDSAFMGKRWPFLKPPSSFPVCFSVKLGPRFHPQPESGAKSLGKMVENYYRAALPPGERTP